MFPVMTPSDPITSCNTRVGKTHPLDCRHGGQGGTLVSLALASRCRPVRSNDGNHARDHPTYSTLVGKGAFFDFVAIQRIGLPDPRLTSYCFVVPVCVRPRRRGRRSCRVDRRAVKRWRSILGRCTRLRQRRTILVGQFEWDKDELPLVFGRCGGRRRGCRRFASASIPCRTR